MGREAGRRRKTRSLRASLLKRGRLRENKTKWTDKLRERERGGGGERVGKKDKMDKAGREPETHRSPMYLFTEKLNDAFTEKKSKQSTTMMCTLSLML